MPGNALYPYGANLPPWSQSDTPYWRTCTSGVDGARELQFGMGPKRGPLSVLMEQIGPLGVRGPQGWANNF